MDKNKKKILKLILQLVITSIALYIVFINISLSEVLLIINDINLFYFFLAFVFFNFSKLLSAIRLNVFFRSINLNLEFTYNLSLYYLGMFYNFFLPGGIGGDGYKIYVLNRIYQTKLFLLIQTLLMDRISGLIGLIFLLLFLLPFSSFALLYEWVFYISPFMLIILYPIYNKLIRNKFEIFSTNLIITNTQGLLVQFLQVVCIYFLIKSLNMVNGFYIDIFIVFLISSFVSSIPLTVGGIGAREFTFLYLFPIINQEAELGVSISLLFLLITLFSSFVGIFYIFKFNKEVIRK